MNLFLIILLELLIFIFAGFLTYIGCNYLDMNPIISSSVVTLVISSCVSVNVGQLQEISALLVCIGAVLCGAPFLHHRLAGLSKSRDQ